MLKTTYSPIAEVAHYLDEFSNAQLLSLRVGLRKTEVMKAEDIDLDMVEFTAETSEWLSLNHPNIKTVGNLAELEPYKDMPESVADDLCWALGYYIWLNLRCDA